MHTVVEIGRQHKQKKSFDDTPKWFILVGREISILYIDALIDLF